MRAEAFRGGIADRAECGRGCAEGAIKDADVEAVSLGAAPSVAMHDAPAPRIAMMHTWGGTQTEGWWREALDKLHVPYEYISTQTASHEGDLRAKYDVIIFAPVGRSSTQQIVNGMPMWGNALPWQKTDLTPNLTIDSTEDMRAWAGTGRRRAPSGFCEKVGC